MRGAWAGIAAAALMGLSGTAAAAPSPAWTATPAAGRPYVYLEGPAGSVLEDTLSLTNPGAKPLTVRLSGQGGTPLAFAARTVTVPARTRADVPFALTVTADTAPGEHRGAVRAEAAGREVRVAVHLRVSGPSLAALTVEKVRLDGSGTLHYTLVNRGNTLLAPRLSVRAEGAFGTVLDRPARALPLTLRPGERITRSEPWSDPPALDSVTVHLRATAPGAAPATARAERLFLPLGPPVAVAGVLLAAAAVVTYRIRRRARPGPEPGSDVGPGPGMDPEPRSDRDRDPDPEPDPDPDPEAESRSAERSGERQMTEATAGAKR
ncbi:hypothetical protein [Streptomyces sp. ISL-36]|uniref:COG1470 family protein n=1 Tax=Streptomyces sp. ISL-36 TaxID=2819182 RepID=UPI002035152F|nr:hypothetical protein [Streptomyces sp. ISL-36]